MAEKIQGITVTIGGDTSGLDKALRGTNKEIGETQSELKKVERLLKLDPTNTTLLEQRQQLLGKAIGDTSSKLDTLKVAERQAQEQFAAGKVSEEQYRALQREVVATEQSLKGLESKAKQTGEQFDYLGTKAGKMNDVMQKAALGAVGVGVALVGSAVKAGKAADDINTLAKQTGLSTEAIQKFQYASEIIDVPLETLTGSMSKLTKNMATAQKGSGDAATAFKTLGVEIVNTADGSLRGNQDVFDETIKKLGELENETQRDALAMQIFGKSAQDLNPLILGGADALTQLGDEAEAAGLILSQDTLDGANAFNDSLDTLKAQGAAAFGKIGSEIAEKLLPVMGQIIEAAQEAIQWILGNGDKIISVLAAISAGLVAFNVVTMIQGLITVFKGWQLATDGMALSQKMLNLAMAANPIALVVTLIAGLVAAIAILWTTNEDFRIAVVAVWDAIRLKFEQVVSWIKTAFVTDWSTSFGVVGEVLNAFFANASNVWDSVKTVMDGFITFISGVFSGNWQQAWQGIVDMFGGIFDGLLAFAKAPLNGIIALINGVIDAINTMINGLNNISFDIPKWVPKLGGQSFGLNIPSIGNIPYLAKGGNLFSGSAVVGEAGPELLQMMGGHAVVTPLSSGTSGGGKPAVNVEMTCNFGNGYNATNGAAAAREMVRAINRELGRAY